MKRDKEKTKVVFRVYSDGEVIALFPRIPSDYGGNCCMSYSHFGQHGGGNSDVTVDHTRPATPKQFIRLKRELKQIGYNLQVGKRCTTQDREERRRKAKQFAF